MSGIDHRLKLVWIHVPKTGGRSIEKGLSINARGHRSIREYLAKKANYLSAAFVRHPADRLWSTYNAAIQHKRYWKHIKKCGSWKVFVNTIENHYKKMPHTRPMTHWLCNKKKLAVNFIGRFENIDSDYKRLCEMLNVPTNSLPHINKSKHISWRQACSKADLKKIKQFYKKDFRIFGYE